MLLFAGSSLALLGLSIIVGWHMQTAVLVQWSPNFAPTHYLTASGFLFGGVGLIALALDRVRVAAACGSAAFLIGCTTFAAHFLDLNFGTEQFVAGVSSLGRSSPNSALSLIVSGAAIYIAAKRLLQKQPLLILGLMGALVIALALAILFGHLRGLQTAYGWASDARTGVTSMTGFMVLGIGVLAAVWHCSIWKISNAAHWIAALGRVDRTGRGPVQTLHQGRRDQPEPGRCITIPCSHSRLNDCWPGRMP